MRAAHYVGEVVHPLIAGLIEALPELDEPLGAKRRADWLDVADKVLRLLYPESPALPTPTEEQTK